MPKPFDATTKELLESDPRAWLELLLGRKVGEVRILNVDLSTITTEADTVLLVQEIEPWVVHVEFQSSYDPDLPLRLRRAQHPGALPTPVPGGKHTRFCSALTPMGRR